LAIKTLKQRADEARQEAAIVAVAGQGDVERPFIEAAGAVLDRARAVEPGWLTGLREQALESFRRVGLPHRRVEEWKYTDLRQIVSSRRDDMTFDFDPLAMPQTSAGVSVSAIGTDHGEESWPEAVKNLLVFDANPMAALAFALAPRIVVARVPARAQDATMTWEQNAGTLAGRGAFCIIIVEEGARLSLFERPRSGGFLSSATLMTLAEGARATHVALARPGAAMHVHTRMIGLSKDATYDAAFAQFGGALTRNEIRVEMNGPHAEVRLRGAYMLSGDDHCDTTTVIRHNVPSCSSNQVFKGVMTDHARGVYQGKVRVAEDAQHTDARQMSKTLLLSDHCEVDAKPELVIYADDVQCAHGATSGDLDEDAIFYLRARGIPEATARRLLIEAFLQDVFESLSDDGGRADLEREISDWLAVHADRQTEKA